MAPRKSEVTEVSTSAAAAGKRKPLPAGSDETRLSPSLTEEFLACTFQVSEWGATPRMCMRRAAYVVTWSNERYGVVQYCMQHYRGVEKMLSDADDVFEVLPEMC